MRTLALEQRVIFPQFLNILLVIQRLSSTLSFTRLFLFTMKENYFQS